MSVFESKQNPIFFIAEIGGNHEGDFEYAKRLTRLAIESGADAIKFQFYTGDSLVSRIESKDRNQHFKKFELSNEQNIHLMEMVVEAGGLPMASVWDKEMLTWADPYLPIHKVGSGDLTCYPMIEALVETKKPIILSTGLSSLADVKDTVEFIGKLDGVYITDRKLALLQCTSSYPTPDDDANINAMLELEKEFGLPVGYSDHTIGALAIEVATSLGARIIEKHFTDTREGKTFRDHKVSLNRDEVRSFLLLSKKIQTLKGKKEKFLTPSEKISKHHISFRRSVYCKKDVRKGEILNNDNLTVLRPEHGISAKHYQEIIGKKAKRDLKSHEVLNRDDFE